MVVGLLGQAVGTALFPYMARFAAEDKREQLNDLLNKTLRLLSLVIPISVLFMVLRNELVLMLFQRGKFDMSATQLTADILPYFFLGAFAFSAQTIVARGYYAVQNTLFPAIFGSIAVLLGIPVYWYCMQWMGVCGIALAVSISAFLQVAIIYCVWNRQSNNKGAALVYRFAVKVLLISIPVGVFIEWIRTKILFIDSTTFLGSFVISAVVTTTFFVMILVLGFLFRLEEIRYIYDRIRLRAGNKNTG